AGNTGENLKVVLAGEDAEVLRLASAAVTRDLRTLWGIGNVTSGASLQRTEIHVTPDVARAADLGVSATAMPSVIRVATAGDYDANLPKLNLPQRQIPIRVRLYESVRHDLDAARQLRVAANSGEVALETVADLRMGSGPAQIDRYDRQ